MNTPLKPQLHKHSVSQCYYFLPNAIMCYTKEWHLQKMKENNIKEQLVFRAKVERGIGLMFCKLFEKFGESKDCCGRNNCHKYSPRNMRSGICKEHGYFYYPAEEVTLHL
jgi:hypothetical protein